MLCLGTDRAFFQAAAKMLLERLAVEAQTDPAFHARIGHCEGRHAGQSGAHALSALGTAAGAIGAADTAAALLGPLISLMDGNCADLPATEMLDLLRAAEGRLLLRSGISAARYTSADLGRIVHRWAYAVGYVEPQPLPQEVFEYTRSALVKNSDDLLQFGVHDAYDFEILRRHCTRALVPFTEAPMWSAQHGVTAEVHWGWIFLMVCELRQALSAVGLPQAVQVLLAPRHAGTAAALDRAMDSLCTVTSDCHTTHLWRSMLSEEQPTDNAVAALGSEVLHQRAAVPATALLVDSLATLTAEHRRQRQLAECLQAGRAEPAAAELVAAAAPLPLPLRLPLQPSPRSQPLPPLAN